MSTRPPTTAVAAAAAALARLSGASNKQARDLEHRRRVLDRSPAHVRPMDLRRLLSDELGHSRADRAMAIALRRGVTAALLWQWSRRHGAELAALALDAGFGPAELDQHLTDLGAVDAESLRLHAELTGACALTILPPPSLLGAKDETATPGPGRSRAA